MPAHRQHLDTDVENAILAFLHESEQPAPIDEIVRQLICEDESLEPVEIKISALNLVERGLLELNKKWEFSVLEGTEHGRQKVAAVG